MIVISTHVLTSGPSQALKRFLIENKKSFLWIEHPLINKPWLKGDGFELFEYGVKKKQFYTKRLIYFKWLKDFLLNIYFVLKNKKKIDLFIGVNSLNALSGLLLKKLGLVKKCVYYSIDFVPKRFNNGFLNSLYHKIESYCAINSDEVWNLSDAMIKARQKYNNIKKKNNQLVVPIGIWLKDAPKKIVDFNRYQVVFMGTILKKQGIQYIIKSIPEIIKKLPKFKLLIIGDGPFIPDLKKLISRLGVEKYVSFMGFVESDLELIKLLSHSAVGIALYETGNKLTNFTYYTDPGKLKFYLSCGLPIILTKTPPNAEELVNNKCALITKINKNDISKNIIFLLQNKRRLLNYKLNSLKYIQRFDWNKIFSNVLNK